MKEIFLGKNPIGSVGMKEIINNEWNERNNNNKSVMKHYLNFKRFLVRKINFDNKQSTNLQIKYSCDTF